MSTWLRPTLGSIPLDQYCLRLPLFDNELEGKRLEPVCVLLLGTKRLKHKVPPDLNQQAWAILSRILKLWATGLH